MPSNSVTLNWLGQALWLIAGAALVAWLLDRAARRWGGAHERYTVWIGAQLFAAVAVWLPIRRAGGAFRIAIEGAWLNPVAPVAPGGTAWPWLAWALVLWVLFRWLRITYGLVRLRGLNESTTSGPIVVWRRVIIPRWFVHQATAAALRAARAHEGAHQRASDFLVNVLLELAAAPVAWHPAYVWIRREITLAREMRCDAEAALELPDPDEYRRGLLEAAELLARRKQAGWALGLFDQDSLEERLMALTHLKQISLARRGAFTIAALAVFLLCAAGATQRLFAVDEKVYKVGGDVRSPVLVHRVEPQYTDAARNEKISGKVLLDVVVNAQGEIHDAEVVEALGYGLDENAITAVKKWKFEPGRKVEDPVAVRARIEINFRLE